MDSDGGKAPGQGIHVWGIVNSMDTALTDTPDTPYILNKGCRAKTNALRNCKRERVTQRLLKNEGGKEAMGRK
jgi:hypothetical protein